MRTGRKRDLAKSCRKPLWKRVDGCVTTIGRLIRLTPTEHRFSFPPNQPKFPVHPELQYLNPESKDADDLHPILDASKQLPRLTINSWCCFLFGHPPPHFHARNNDGTEAVIEFESLKVIHCDLSRSRQE